MACQELTQNGLMYKDEETGEEKIIPRFVDDSGYEYTEKEKETKDALFMNCKLRYPDVDPYIIECLIDYWLKYPDDMKKHTGTTWKPEPENVPENVENDDDDDDDE